MSNEESPWKEVWYAGPTSGHLGEATAMMAVPGGVLVRSSNWGPGSVGNALAFVPNAVLYQDPVDQKWKLK